MRGGVKTPAEADATRGLLEALPAVTYVDSPTGDHLEYISPQVEAIFGFKRERWLDRAFWTERVHPDDAAYVRSAYRRSLRTGLPYSAEYRMLAADGRVVWVQAQAAPVHDAAGGVRAFAGLLIDISERHRADESLRLSEARYRALVEASPDAIVVTDLEGRVLMANETAANLAGFEHAGELVGRHALERVAERDRAAAADALGRAALGEPIRGLEFQLDVSGRAVPVEASWQAIAGDSGPEALIGVIRDVSERAAAAEARRDAEAKSRFLATMSHELRTPLNSILGFAQLLASQDFGTLTDRQERYVGHIEASGRQLLDLVNEILDLSRARSGRLDLALETRPVAVAMADAVTRIRPAAMVKGVELAEAIDPELDVVADQRRLGQVVWHLLSNAVKFTPAGGAVTLRARRDDGQCVIEVEDTGIGIPAGDRERVFDEFFQVESGRARPREGSGIGLALGRRLVELMGGTISVESEVGAGSRFTARLPAGAYHRTDDLALHGGAPAPARVRPKLRVAGGRG